MKYEIPQEKISLAATPGATKIRNACSSHKAEYRWLRLDMCVSRKDPPRGVELPRVFSSREAAEAIRKLLNVGDLIQEVFGVLCINSAGQVVSMAVPFRGGVASAPVEIATMLKPVLLTPTCVAFMCFHNHPSGNAQASQDDVTITEKIAKAAKIIGVAFLDHIIVTEKDEFSLADHGLIR